ncbi:MAG: oxaloacetate decarboxylase, partial [bacterium]
MTSPRQRLRELLSCEEILVAPGAYDALLAKLVEQSGFEAVYMTGAGIANSLLGQPDVGLVTLTEMAARAAHIANAVNVPVLADADTGYGNAVNVIRTVRAYEQAGIAAIQLEDQVTPKKCGHFTGREVISVDEMVGKIRAAAYARQDPDFAIIARTDARTDLGLEEAIDRGQRYAEAGADIVFVESPESVEEMRAITAAIDAPLLANMVETGRTPLLSARELQEIGYKIVIFPGSLTR